MHRRRVMCHWASDLTRENAANLALLPSIVGLEERDHATLRYQDQLRRGRHASKRVPRDAAHPCRQRVYLLGACNAPQRLPTLCCAVTYIKNC